MQVSLHNGFALVFHFNNHSSMKYLLSSEAPCSAINQASSVRSYIGVFLSKLLLTVPWILILIGSVFLTDLATLPRMPCGSAFLDEGNVRLFHLSSRLKFHCIFSSEKSYWPNLPS